METDAVKLLLFTMLFSSFAIAGEAFKIELYDRKVRVESPLKMQGQYAVIVENLSMSDVMGKFHAGGKDLKFINVKAGASRSIEFKHQGGDIVRFQPLSPAFQEIELIAGKKNYEIPPKP